MKKKSFVVAIAGGTASGKSTFAKMLAEKFPEKTTVVSMDMYYKDQSQLPLEARRAANMDCPEAFDVNLFAKHIQALILGENIAQPLYDFSTHTRLAHSKEIEAKKLIIAEGLLVLYDPELLKLYDLKIYLEAEADLRLARRLLRDLEEKRYETPQDSINQYLTSARPNHKIYIAPQKKGADLVVDWNEIKKEEIKRIANIIKIKAPNF